MFDSIGDKLTLKYHRIQNRVTDIEGNVNIFILYNFLILSRDSFKFDFSGITSVNVIVRVFIILLPNQVFENFRVIKDINTRSKLFLHTILQC